MRKKKQVGLSDSIKSPVKTSVPPRQWRERITRVVSSPIKGKDTNAKQWNRWTP